ncbi:hypothetical protein PAHAL_9G626400 [Panicum hallii]|uniref:Uncharacterized protein n=1 Tax=Panicum hallii TaxID=206008 RepID=A0A2T8I6M0_9POAL|nr:hypothetical protein PAHAL_9G626400 [Panicum hallii]
MELVNRSHQNCKTTIASYMSACAVYFHRGRVLRVREKNDGLCLSSGVSEKWVGGRCLLQAHRHREQTARAPTKRATLGNRKGKTTTTREEQIKAATNKVVFLWSC